MKYIGLTGGIGSGKTLIARILQCMGYPVYLSDPEASRLMNTHPQIRKELIARFGHEVYTSEGIINKPFVAQIIFNTPEALQAINQIVHPRVMEDFRLWGEVQQQELVFFESAILFEAGLAHFFDGTICVTAPEEIRLTRVINRDNTQAEQVRVRMRNQMDDRMKCQQADFIIYNDSDHLVITQVIDILNKITNSHL